MRRAYIDQQILGVRRGGSAAQKIPPRKSLEMERRYRWGFARSDIWDVVCNQVGPTISHMKMYIS